MLSTWALTSISSSCKENENYKTSKSGYLQVHRQVGRQVGSQRLMRASVNRLPHVLQLQANRKYLKPSHLKAILCQVNPFLPYSCIYFIWELLMVNQVPRTRVSHLMPGALNPKLMRVENAFPRCLLAWLSMTSLKGPRIKGQAGIFSATIPSSEYNNRWRVCCPWSYGCLACENSSV